MSYVDEINQRVMRELTEIMLCCNTCDFQVRELLKVANCLFEQDEFFAVVEAFTQFTSNMEILEALVSQLSEPITILQLVTLKSMVNELRVNFTELTALLAIADVRIDEDHIDFEAANLLNDLLEKVEFDVVCFFDFEAALQSRYFIPYQNFPKQPTSDRRYGNLTVLQIETFKTKREAYTYALKHGFSRDMVWSMYN